MDEEERKVSKKNLAVRIRENPWVLSTFVLGILILILFVTNFSTMTSGTISEIEAGEYLLNYFEAQGVSGLSVKSVDKEGDLYKVNIDYENQLIPFYVTKSGYLTGNSILSIIPSQNEQEDFIQNTEIPKSDKPIVELFVMSYCPYGTQAEKGIIPAVELFGDKIDFRIRYVSYLMHGEKEAVENLREYCIQEVAPEKFLDYMTCFLEGDGQVLKGYIRNGNDPDKCMTQAGIDKAKVDACRKTTDEEYSISESLKSEERYPRFNVEKELNEKYSVQGSPTLVINNQVVNSGRSPANYLDVICQAFNEVPEECGAELDSETPSAYFGWDKTGTSTSAQCG